MFNQSYNQASNNRASNCNAKKESECREFIEVVQLILDDEASEKQVNFFKEHIDNCTHCLEHYNLEKSVADAIKSKLKAKCCPDDLIRSIKQKIREASI